MGRVVALVDDPSGTGTCVGKAKRGGDGIGAGEQANDAAGVGEIHGSAQRDRIVGRIAGIGVAPVR